MQQLCRKNPFHKLLAAFFNTRIAVNNNCFYISDKKHDIKIDLKLN